ncbi:MAG: sigma 54-interacting transcriptional regulator [Pseudomonadota bacterium]
MVIKSVVKGKMDDNVFVREAVLRICGSLQIEDSLRRCLEYIKDLIPAESIDLTIFVRDINVMEVIASASLEGWTGPPRILPLPDLEFDGHPENSRNVDSNLPVKILNRPDLEPFALELAKIGGVPPDFSLMVLRLELEGFRVGNLALKAKGHNRFTEEHARLLLLLREPFAIAMSNALKHQEVHKLKDMLADDNLYLQRELRELSGADIIGADFGLREIMEMVRQAAPLDSPVLLLGETGVGKEVLANFIHNASPRREGPLIKVNCGAIPESLVDSELFGHERGAFTGAVRQKRGRFERADGGTIFLDEVGDLPFPAQARLLRAIQHREIERVGGTQPLTVDIRIISATHRNLPEMIAAGKFREDLWYRLNVFPVMIPPLRRRKGDIPALVHHFVEKKSLDLKIYDRPRLAPKAMDQLLNYDWPGNVRELENVVERALIRRSGEYLSFAGILAPQRTGDAGPESGLLDDGDFSSLDEVNARHIRRALEKARGKISGPGSAAELLGVHPNTLRKRMDKLGITYGRRG